MGGDANTFGWIGRILAISQVPLLSFSVTLLARLAVGAAWSWWGVCVPLFVLLFWLLLVTTTPRVPAPSFLRYAWITTLIALCSFMCLVIVRVQTAPSVLVDNLYIMFLPHILLATAFLAMGVLSFIKCGVARRTARRRNKHFAVGFALSMLGVVWAVMTALAFKKLSVTGGDLKSDKGMSWFAVFSPWFAADMFALFMGILMFVFSLGASRSAMFPLYQQVIYILSCIASIGLKIALALELSFDTAPVATGACAIGMEVLLGLCGLSLALGRNRETVLFEVKRAATSDTPAAGPVPAAPTRAKKSRHPRGISAASIQAGIAPAEQQQQQQQQQAPEPSQLDTVVVSVSPLPEQAASETQPLIPTTV